MNLAEIKFGEWIISKNNLFTFAYRVKRLTKTRIVVQNIDSFNYDSSEISFDRETGVRLPRSNYDYTKIERYATPAEIELAQQRDAQRTAEKIEIKRLDVLTSNVTIKLKELTGVDIRAVCWGRTADGVRTFRLEADGLSEADLQQILSR
jgi:hypothetical protein